MDGRPAVKLSDNPEKATGIPSEVERYLRVFGNVGRVHTAVRLIVSSPSCGLVGHPHYAARQEDVDARDKPGHDW